MHSVRVLFCDILDFESHAMWCIGKNARHGKSGEIAVLSAWLFNDRIVLFFHPRPALCPIS